MPVADFRCRDCGIVLELDIGHGAVTDIIHHDAEDNKCAGRMDRIWSAPHTGSGSSGEPPH